jgi:hypothetical protein
VGQERGKSISLGLDKLGGNTLTSAGNSEALNGKKYHR